MPSGTITHTTFASSTVLDNAHTSFIVPSSYLKVGVNSIAVEIHNRSLNSSDISFDAKITSNQDNVGPAPGTTAIAYGAVWAYYDGVIAPPSSWNQATFDDDSWQLGASQLEYGDGDEATELSYGPNSQNKTISYYFRKNVELDSVDASSTLTMSVTYDDGFVCYVNGQEVHRQNMPTGVITHTTFASSTVSNNAQTSFVVPSSFLNAGTNTIAFEMHNRTLTSSDISFDAEINSNQDNLGPIDFDEDGIDDAWEVSHVGNLTTLKIDGDFDKDGIVDLMEYAINSAPHEIEIGKTPLKGEPAIDGLGNQYLAVTFDRNTSASNLEYTLQHSTDMKSGNWVDAGSYAIQQGSPTDNGDGTKRYTYHCYPANANAKQFFVRLKVSKR